MINKVILTGRLTSDLELRKTNDLTSYVLFTLAVNRGTNRQSSGTNQQQTDFIPCIAWRGTSEIMSRYLKKGSLIGLEGKLMVYRQENNGVYTVKFNISVTNFTFLETKKTDSQAENNVSFANEVDTSQTTKLTEKNDSKNDQTNNVNNDDDNINFDDIEF